MKKLFTIMSVVVVALLLVACGSSSPKDVTNSYYKALQKGDYEKALSYTTAVDDKDEIQKEIKKMEGLDVKIPEYEIVSEEISDDGQTAVVEVKYKFTSSFNSEPEESTNKVKLIKQDGKWKIKG
ncbi:MAG: DUF4878 domain-containing protein [Bacteroidales bacterium]|nr:DUF4878 domain-containing protein [Bacteroidales bacterium]